MDLYLRMTRAGFQNVFRPHENVKPAGSNSSRLKSVFEKLRRFRDGLVWTVGLTVEIKLRFQISLAYCGRGQKLTPESSVIGLCFLTNKV